MRQELSGKMTQTMAAEEPRREFYRTFFRLFLPLVLQNMITLGVNLADNIMLGQYSEAALSGVTAANQVQFIYQQILMGIGDGLVIIATQYWGKQQGDKVKEVSSVAMRLSIFVMLVFFAVLCIFPSGVTSIFSPDPAIIHEGTAYLEVVKYTYLIFGFTSILLATLRAVQIVNIALVLSVVALGVNVTLNWILIYGKLGFPAMGVTGAAIATLIARVVELGVLLIYISRKEKLLHLRISDYLHVNKDIRHDYYKVSLPIIFLQSIWGLNTAIQTAILGQMSSSAIAANSMASNLFLLVKTAAIGAASSANVIIGHTIGSGNLERVKVYAKRFQKLFLVIGALSAVLLFALIEPILSLYSFSEESASLARQFLYVLCFVVFTMSYQMPVNGGIIKGGGDTKYLMKLDLISIWAIVLPVSFLLAFVVKASPVVVVIALNSDQIFKCVPAFIKVNYGKWIKKLTRD